MGDGMILPILTDRRFLTRQEIVFINIVQCRD